MEHRKPRVGVFCGAKPGRRPAYVHVARELGTALGRQGTGLVYGGSAGGLMGTVATATMAAGGHVVGVIPRHLLGAEPMQAGLDECHIVDTMHERKSLMYDLSDAFVALPGGFGTLDELLETLTWSKLSLHRKPIVVLNVDGYFDALLGLLDHARVEGFLSAADRALVSTTDSVNGALRLVARDAPRTSDPAVVAIGRR